MAPGQGEQDRTDDADRIQAAADDVPTTALARRVPLTASVVTAPAMKRLTNGVAIPSFRPLSTLSNRRTPDGTRSSCMMETAESGVGGGHDGTDRRSHPEPAATEKERRMTAPAPIVSGKPIPSRRAGRATSVRRARTFTRRRVSKEDEGQGQLGQGADGRVSAG